jgi:lipopolysaccharide export LptBFGC system permease protein LptF
MNVLICAGMVFAFHVSDAVLLALGKAGRLLPFLSAWGGNIIFATFAFFRLEKANY